VEVVRGADGRVAEVVATGGGWGHGIGMCQVGAMGRARAGQDYRAILSAYYPGTRLRDLY
jgi:stage II sporulation protein D